LVDPQDYDGLNLALVAGLHSDLKAVPRRYNWSPARYWCPFRAGYVGANSRLAVAAQVLLVNGGTKPEDPSTAELYSINFSWSTMDRTWRWRKFPAPACYFKAGTAQFEQMEEAACPPAPEPGCVYPETIRLREDMTIHVKGMRRMADGTVSKGRWFQRYLPATNKMPAVAAAGSRPEAYTHQWRFMTEEAWAAADRFSHLGVYGIVNSRMQCYVLQFSKPETRTILEQAGAGPWFEPNGKLWVEGYSFRWQTLQLHWPPVLPPPKGARRPPSLFNPAPLLRIVNRGGPWIAMHWDKRDDDLLPYGGPDAEVELQNGTSRVSVRVLDNRRFEEPPVVTSAGFWLEQTGTPGSPRAFLGFVTPKQQGGLANVWRVRLEAIVPGQFDATVSILNLTSDNFTISAEGFHQYSWQPTAEQSAQLTKYCSSEGAMRYGTSLWFEDVVGHVNVPEWMLWDGAPAAIATISPTSVPFNRQVTVVIQVKNVRTSTTLNREVYVNGNQIGSTVKPISHTFEPVSIEMFSTPEPDPDTGGAVLNIGAFVDNDDDSDPAPVPPREVNPKVTVRVPGYPEAAVPLLFYYP
ncbi:MAG TPA: hypothetical protein VEQ63_00730, partial [Bryobacteraceae bacterium]|nr:hypothetical protein [Bryobacteraceae bacterium]